MNQAILSKKIFTLRNVKFFYILKQRTQNQHFSPVVGCLHLLNVACVNKKPKNPQRIVELLSFQITNCSIRIIKHKCQLVKLTLLFIQNISLKVQSLHSGSFPFEIDTSKAAAACADPCCPFIHICSQLKLTHSLQYTFKGTSIIKCRIVQTITSTSTTCLSIE